MQRRGKWTLLFLLRTKFISTAPQENAVVFMDNSKSCGSVADVCEPTKSAVFSE
jgi:hypothetical protein